MDKRDGDSRKAKGSAVLSDGFRQPPERAAHAVTGVRLLARAGGLGRQRHGPELARASRRQTRRYDTRDEVSAPTSPTSISSSRTASQSGSTAICPTRGLAVYHCDTLGSNEWQDGTRNEHYQCALLQADGHLDLENNRNPGDPGDLFQAQAGVVLSDTTMPAQPGMG